MTSNSPMGVSRSRIPSNFKKAAAASASVLALSLMAQPVMAQTNTDADEIVVTSSRQIQQDAIALKRDNAQIVDGLSADEIGDIPALSIGEALETITGVTSHRENGGATEVSIRGLGPFLSSTVVNGRAATNGSGDRSVNFSQFPSELINKLSVFKTQDATQIEGGVAGQIQLETIKPLDFGKRRIQFEVKGNVNPDQLNIDDSEAGDFGYRATGSYTDQFEVGGGDIGISIGVQRSDISQPEAESRQTGVTSNSRPACAISNGAFTSLLDSDGEDITGFSNNPARDDDCDDINGDRVLIGNTSINDSVEGIDTTINPNTGIAVDAGIPFVFAPSQRQFRQNDTRDERDAIFGAIQWEPNDRLEINIDGQYSNRSQTEQRSDLTFNGGRRNDTSLNVGAGDNVVQTTTLDSLIATPDGAILRSITDGNIEIGGGNFEREETYYGAGINVAYDITDRWQVSADYGYSRTEREEDQQEFRIQSDLSPVIEFDRTNGAVPQYTLYDGEFDVNNVENYVDRLRVRIDNDLSRENVINSFRADTVYNVDGGFIKDVLAGVRYGRQSYLDLPGGADSGDPLNANSGRFSFEIENDGELTVNNREVLDDNNEEDDPTDDDFDALALAQQQALEPLLDGIITSTRDACVTDFQEGNDFLRSVREGDLITNVFEDDDGNVVTTSTNSFASLDAQCTAETAVASLNGILDQINEYSLNPNANENSFGQALGLFSSDIPGLTEENVRTIDVVEETFAGYLQATYETTLDGTLPISGHIGARIVRTEVDALGYRQALSINVDDEGGLSLQVGDNVEAIETSSGYTRVLPSASAILEVADDKLVRLGVFRALSRADVADLGFGRTFSTNSSDDGDSPTTLSALLGNVSGNGNPNIGPLDSWNYDAAFEWYPNPDTIFAIGAYYKSLQGGFINTIQTETFEFNGEDVDLDVGGIQQVSDDTSEIAGFELTASHGFTYLPGLLSGLGFKVSYNYADSNFEFEDSRYGDVFVEQPDGSLVQTNEGVIDPVNIPGLSKHVLAAQGYWGTGPFDVQVNYKYRSSYFQPFTSDGTRIRITNGRGIWEARASYKLNDNFRLSAEAINLFSSERRDSGFVQDDIYLVNDYGPRVFFGIRGRF